MGNNVARSINVFGFWYIQLQKSFLLQGYQNKAKKLNFLLANKNNFEIYETFYRKPIERKRLTRLCARERRKQLNPTPVRGVGFFCAIVIISIKTCYPK